MQETSPSGCQSTWWCLVCMQISIGYMRPVQCRSKTVRGVQTVMIVQHSSLYGMSYDPKVGLQESRRLCLALVTLLDLYLSMQNEYFAEWACARAFARISGSCMLM